MNGLKNLLIYHMNIFNHDDCFLVIYTRAKQVEPMMMKSLNDFLVPLMVLFRGDGQIEWILVIELSIYFE